MHTFRLNVPPSQHTFCTHQEISDGEAAVLSSYVKAHAMTDKGAAALWALTPDGSDGINQYAKRFASEDSPWYMSWARGLACQAGWG